MKNLFVFDIEAISLHGTGFAAGAIVANRNGSIIDQFELLSTESLSECVDFVKDHVIPQLAKIPTVSTNKELRVRFYEFYMKHKDSCFFYSDVNFPVETNFLSAIVADDPTRMWDMPYPLYDISTVVPINIERHEASGIKGLRKHHPIDDAIASLACFLNYIN